MRIARPQSRPIRDRPALAALLVAVLLAIPASASANVGETIVDRCTHGESLSGFSQSAYNQALNELSADTEEYSDCSSLIRQAQINAAAGKRGGGAGGGGSAGSSTAAAVAATPEEQRSITHAAHDRSAPVQLSGQSVVPGVVHTNISSALSSLPTPLLATLAFLLAGLLLIAGGVARNRFRARRFD
jgi:hypothetical protein